MMTSPATAKKPPNQFTEVEVVRDPDGVIAIVTESSRDGRISFMLAREFEQNGATKRSSFLSKRHMAGVRRLLADLEERLELAEDRARAKKR